MLFVREPVLDIRDLVRDFDGLRAVDHVSISVREGEIYGFLGPNGAGKTTTLRILAGLLEPTSGEVLIRGRNLIEDPEQVRRHLVYLPDTPYVYPHLTMEEFLEVWLELHEVEPDPVEDRRSDLLKRFRIDDKRHELTNNLSHGMRQKMLITGLFLLEPDLFLIDEPLVGLDPYSLRQFEQLLRKDTETRGSSVVLSTHSLSAVESFCNRVGILYQGSLIREGNLDAIRDDPDEALEEVFLRLTESS